MVYVDFSCLGLQYTLGLGSLRIGGGSGPTYTGARRGLFPLITHFSIIFSMGMEGLNNIRGLDCLSE